MPRAARFRVSAIEELLRQLEYAPAETRQRQMDAAERLIADLDPQQNYPEDFVIFRITGYRPDRIEEPVTLVGQALLPDLVNLVQTLSAKLDLPRSREGGEALTLEQVEARLKVSRKTIQRYRKQGLVCHSIEFEGERRLVCYADALERFLASHQPQVRRAAEFSRVNGALEAEIIAQARRLRDVEHLSLNEAARRIALEIGRAHETIRQMLRRHESKARPPKRRNAEGREKVERGPLTEREARLLHRAWLRGIEPGEMAQRFSKSKPAVHRAINRHRRDLLGSVQLSFIHLPTFDLPEAEAVILSAAPVVSDLPATRRCRANDLLDAAQATKASVDAEHALLAAYNLLKKRAAHAIAELGYAPNSDALDMIETDLRWIAALRRKLILLALPAAIRRIEHNYKRKVKSARFDELESWLRQAVDVAAQVLEEIDPGRRQRLDRMTAFAMDKSLAQRDGDAPANHKTGEPLDLSPPWERWLALRPDLPHLVRSLDEPASEAIARRYGLTGEPPQTNALLAPRLKLTEISLTRLLQAALRELRRLARLSARGAEHG